jgi:hypothetical protein
MVLKIFLLHLAIFLRFWRLGLGQSSGSLQLKGVIALHLLFVDMLAGFIIEPQSLLVAPLLFVATSQTRTEPRGELEVGKSKALVEAFLSQDAASEYRFACCSVYPISNIVHTGLM